MVIYNEVMYASTKGRRYFGWILLGIGLLMAIQMSLNIWRVYRSGRRLEQARKQLDEAQRQQEELRKNLVYVQSPEFIEKEAREKLGMGRPGEVVLILPKFANKPSEISTPVLSSWQKWWRLYVGI